MENKEMKTNVIVRLIQGALIGAGSVLPGVSGGVLAVLFGVYLPLMKFLAHPFKEWKNALLSLWPILVGFVVGYIGIAKLLAEVLARYESQALALFVGLTIGIMPSLFREAGEKGRNKQSWVSLSVVFLLAMGILTVCRVLEVVVEPSLLWNMFGGFCLVLSVICPGMSSSVLLMPLNTATGTLYEHITGAIGNLDFAQLMPIGIGAVLTLLLLTKAVDWLLNNHYSVAFHGIVGIVIASTIFIIPVAAFTAGVGSCLIHLAFVVVGTIATLALDKFNQSVEKP